MSLKILPSTVQHVLISHAKPEPLLLAPQSDLQQHEVLLRAFPPSPRPVGYSLQRRH